MCVQGILFISYFVIIDSTRAPTHLLVTRVGPCFNPQETIGKVSELSVTTQTYDSKLSGVIYITKNISNGWKIKATMEKCVDIRNIGSCDFFNSFFLVKNGCSADDDDQNLYDTLFNFTSPKMKCPIQAGRYELQNYPFHSEHNFVTGVFGYTVRLDGYTVDQKKIFCIETYLQLLYKRNHEWVKNYNVRVTTSGPPDSNSQE